MMKEEVWRNLPKAKLLGCYNRLEVLMLTRRRQGRIMIEYRRQVSTSSVKSANLKVAGLSKISDSV
jgi:hypothetical protein